VNELTRWAKHRSAAWTSRREELAFEIFYRDEYAAEAQGAGRAVRRVHLGFKNFRRGFGPAFAGRPRSRLLMRATRDCRARGTQFYNELPKDSQENETRTGTPARATERGNRIVELGRAEAFFPVREQVPSEDVTPGRPAVSLRHRRAPRGQGDPDS